MINTDTNWTAFASTTAGTVTVFDPANQQVVFAALSGVGPYHYRDGARTAGHRYEFSVPVAGWMESSDNINAAINDESILYGTNE